MDLPLEQYSLQTLEGHLRPLIVPLIGRSRNGDRPACKLALKRAQTALDADRKSKPEVIKALKMAHQFLGIPLRAKKKRARHPFLVWLFGEKLG